MSCNAASDILSIAECPVCFEIMCPPIYQCNIGHSICSNCKLLLPHCPSCDSEIGSSRNFALESLVASVLERPCPFAKYGCQVKLKQDSVEDHCQLCTWREYECAFCDGESTWLGPLQALRRHLLDIHEEFHLCDVGEGSQNFFILPNCNLPKFRFLIVGDALFYFYHTYPNRDTINQYVVEYVGNKEEAEDYAYKISIRSNSSAYRGIEYRELCTNYLMPFKVFKSTLESYDGPVISLEILDLKL